MADRCSHTQCSAPATARVAFDSLACFVWIDPYEAAGPRDVGARGAGALCTRHADRLVAPRGWAVQDRRGAEPRLWSDRPEVSPLPLPSPRVARPTSRVARRPAHDDPGRGSDVTSPLPFAAPPAVPPPVSVSAGTAPPASESSTAPSEPTRTPAALGVRDDIEALLAAPAGPLLSRAFSPARADQPD